MKSVDIKVTHLRTRPRPKDRPPVLSALWSAGVVGLAACGDGGASGGPPRDMACEGESVMATRCDGVPECADGRDEVDCEVSTIDGIRLVSLRVQGGRDGTLEVHHPVRVELELAIDGDPDALGPLSGVVGFTGVDPEGPRCTLGGFDLASPTTDGTNPITVDAMLPGDCIGGDGRSVEGHLWVSFDPLGTVRTSNGEPLELLWVLDGSAGAATEGCEAPDGASCDASWTLVESRGVDIAVTSVTPTTSVAILFPDTLPIAWKPYPDGTPMPQHRPPLLSVNADMLAVGLSADDETAASVAFAIRPVPDFAAGTDVDLDWRPLTVARGQRMAANGHATDFGVEALQGGATTTEPFDLYAEGETYAALADDGVWAPFGVFEVRACANGAAEHRADGVPADSNDCATTEIVVANARTPTPADSAASGDIFSYGVGPWSDSWGSTSTERLDVGFKVLAKAGLGGIGTDNYLTARLRGWVDYDILDARLWAKLPGKLDDNGYRVSLTVFDDVVFNRSNTWTSTRNVVANWTPYSWSDEACLRFTYTYLIDFSIRTCIVGGLGIRNSGELSTLATRQIPLDGGPIGARNTARIGFYTQPWANADLTASATVNAYAVRGGVRASVNVLDTQLQDLRGSSRGAGPTAEMTWRNGVDGVPSNASRITYSIDVDAFLKLQTLAGWVDLWADYYSLWDLEYKRWFTLNIATWRGYDASMDLLHRQLATRTIDGSISKYYESLDGL